MTTKLDPRGRKVKILATVGPASRDPAMLRRLFRAGADAFRVNLSHGDHEGHAATIKAIRALEKEFNRPIAVLCDLQGASYEEIAQLLGIPLGTVKSRTFQAMATLRSILHDGDGPVSQEP